MANKSKASYIDELEAAISEAVSALEDGNSIAAYKALSEYVDDEEEDEGTGDDED